MPTFRLASLVLSLAATLALGTAVAAPMRAGQLRDVLRAITAMTGAVNVPCPAGGDGGPGIEMLCFGFEGTSAEFRREWEAAIAELAVEPLYGWAYQESTDRVYRGYRIADQVDVVVSLKQGSRNLTGVSVMTKAGYRFKLQPQSSRP